MISNFLQILEKLYKNFNKKYNKEISYQSGYTTISITSYVKHFKRSRASKENSNKRNQTISKY